MSEGPGNFIAVIAVVIIAFLMFTIFFRPPPPTIEVTEFSINPDTVKVNNPAILTIRIKNNDEEQSHSFKVEFESHSLVTFYLGGQQLPKENNVWYFNDMLNPSAELTQPIIVKANLEAGIKRLAYSISVSFYFNGKQFEKKELELTVER